MTFSFSIKLQKRLFLAKYIFSPKHVPILISCSDGTLHGHTRSQELNKKAFTINCKNMNKVIDIKLKLNL